MVLRKDTGAKGNSDFQSYYSEQSYYENDVPENDVPHYENDCWGDGTQMTRAGAMWLSPSTLLLGAKDKKTVNELAKNLSIN